MIVVCPFCGSAYISVEPSGDWFFVLCHSCGARGPRKATREHALAEFISVEKKKEVE